METLINHLIQDTEVPNELAIEMTQNDETGPHIIEFLTNKNFNEFHSQQRVVIPLLGLLKQWICLKWSGLDFATKQNFLDHFQPLIFQPDFLFLEHYADIFCLIASKEGEFRNIYEENVYNVLNILEKASTLTNNVILPYFRIVYTIVSKYKVEMEYEALEFIFLETKFSTQLGNFFTSLDYLGTQVGENIIILALKSLLCLHHRKPIPELMSNAILLVTEIIQNYNNENINATPKFIGYCFKFFNNALQLPSFSEEEELRQQFFEYSINALEVTLKNYREADYLLTKILISIASLKQYLSEDTNQFELFLSAAEPSESDKNDVLINPSVFIDRAFTLQSNESNVPMILAISIIQYITKKSSNIASALLTLPINETSARVISICAPSIVKHGFLEDLIVWVSNAASSIEDDDLSIASTLFLLSQTVNYVDDDARKLFLDISLSNLDPSRLVVSSGACQLLEKIVAKGIIPSPEVFQVLLQLSKELNTPHAEKCLLAIAKACPSVISENAAVIYQDIINILMEQLKDVEEDEDSFVQNLNMLESIVLCAGNQVIGEEFIHFVERFLSLEDGEYYPDLSRILCHVVKQKSVYTLQLLTILCESLLNNQSAQGFISYLCRPLLLFIGEYPDDFLKSQLTQQILEISDSVISDAVDFECIGELLSWMFMVDNAVDYTQIYELIKTVLSSEELEDESEKKMAEYVILSLFLARDVDLDNSVELIIDFANNARKRSDKQLAILSLLKYAAVHGEFANDCFVSAANCFDGVNEHKKKENEEEENEEEEFDDESDDFMDENESFDFNSPFDKFSIAEFRNTAAKNCSENVISLMSEKYPDFMQ
ncbi:hypothetical protein TVAG_198810 [Trichomonas vaginalis G3]|uniref:Importin N-terminal domain-containing protein n=1 Tax=Trichomonas vaginalis (strain ATCC PRA-98 / G3) TaxID=412133 RepID=A2DDR6_TRIV3|nr:armadillo (ARM) repeat-containing protein family [Trichomonas vaginalis G3]EAY21442.1 hypothetical protein TVAG_198810 [Trichomonas vaginalis G3]KAI5490655.1 armadillo (ARM) repeat-containing protein family [Trichomonas vaginalis G3]|eukprot:XP_001582428.1 hypothetical protein [Trichomonas vaginalis G3]